MNLTVKIYHFLIQGKKSVFTYSCIDEGLLCVFVHWSVCGWPPPPKPTLCGGGGGGVGTFIEFPFMKMRWLGERGNRPVRLTFWVLLFVCSFSPESHGTPVRGTKRLGTENKRGYKKLIYKKKKKKRRDKQERSIFILQTLLFTTFTYPYSLPLFFPFSISKKGTKFHRL